MKIKRFFTKDKPITPLDVTPFADIVFLLLIFFMLSSTFVVEPGIKLKLPRSKTAEIDPNDKIIITLTSDNKIYLNEKEIQIETLEHSLRLLLSDRQRAVIVRADSSTRYGDVIEILDKVKLAGAQKLAVATEKKQ